MMLRVFHHLCRCSLETWSACSDKILEPEVPHALRLQGVLVGGVTVIFNKQQKYLLGEMLDHHLLLDESHACHASELQPER